MRILMFGDIVGRSGRDALLKALPGLKERYRPDFILANGENAAHGFGLTKGIADELFRAGVDVLTTGNHVWDKSDILFMIDTEKRIIRPDTYPSGTPGRGFCLYTLKDGRTVGVLQVCGRLFMEAMEDPFFCARRFYETYPLGKKANALVVDFHAEATSEKMTLGHFCDGHVSLVAGTHTHVPTSDFMILPNGTGYISDLGMCGDYNSVIGMEKGEAVQRAVTKMRKDHLSPASGEGTVCGVFLETDDGTGRASAIVQIKAGGALQAAG